MKAPCGVILAGGLSSRMGGGDKALLDLNGSSILSLVIARLKPQVGAVVLNANGDPARFSGYALPVVPDSIEGYAGPLAGVLAGLDWAAAHGFDEIVTAAADTPFFPVDLAQHLRMAAAREHTPIALAATPGPGGRTHRHPTFGLWPVALRQDLRAALDAGVRKVVQWTDPHGAAMALFEPGADASEPFFNVNTPEELEIARRRLAGMHG
ncbi:MAG: molybdenum cofactor guanylyltransferase MobA [Alphaproteobacteria bacterium]|nr:molybdenum cofactor guanylyltransferase MobA [Alphaproteobacteria bacterium]NNF23858.1 molybdenum cofactor guanylyltransferase MobA [Paracoccaceae bacterium]